MSSTIWAVVLSTDITIQLHNGVLPVAKELSLEMHFIFSDDKTKIITEKHIMLVYIFIYLKYMWLIVEFQLHIYGHHNIIQDLICIYHYACSTFEIPRPINYRYYIRTN